MYFFKQKSLFYTFFYLITPISTALSPYINKQFKEKAKNIRFVFT